MSRVRWLSTATPVLTCALIALAATGCSAWHAVPLTAQPPGGGAIMPRELKIQTVQGRKVTLHDWTVEGDTLRGVREAWVKGEKVMQPEVLLLGDVALRDEDLHGEGLQRQLEAEEAELAAARARSEAIRGAPKLPSDVRVLLVNGGTIELLNAVVDGDSIRGQGVSRGYRPTAVALNDVVLVETSRFHAGKTIGLLLGFGVVILAAAAVIYLTGDYYGN